MSLFEQLRATANLKSHWSFKRMSVLDQSGNANNLALSAGSFDWPRTPRGQAVAPAVLAALMTAGTSATMDLTTAGTLICVWRQNTPIAGVAKDLFHKGTGWASLLNGY